jgi:GNAT superfamily N-acetyltransferase
MPRTPAPICIPRHLTDRPETFVSVRGHSLEVRALCAGDARALDAFFRGLSLQSRRLRFFTASRAVTPAVLQHFLDVDGNDRAAFVVTECGRGEILAVGQYERAGEGVAEVAFAVKDSMQGEGIGTELLHHVAAHALNHGIARFSADVLGENAQMLDVFRHCGYEMSMTQKSGTCSVMLMLPEGCE